MRKLFLIFVITIFIPFSAYSQITVNEILTGVEKRYKTGFTTDFVQSSTLKAIEVTDTASGKAMFKKPGKMRWEYIEPNKQIIISNGKKLWVYQPAEKQVSVGSAPAIFGDGKGASFLSDITLIRKKFIVSLTGESGKKHYAIKLIPREKGNIDITSIHLLITKKFIVDNIRTVNIYEDETVILLKNIIFVKNIKDSLFNFVTPKGVDEITLTEKN
ncbi:MAG: outer membrane lipoprotein carrier protein LolA [Desulfobacterales bacterium]|nr:outer membrane lipoprotein carrier protein LolA [Desulfobacterales bacterium]